MRQMALPMLLLGGAAALAGFVSPEVFDAAYLLDASTLHVETGLMAVAMTLLIASGNIDLSIASNLALTACLAAMLLRAGWPLVAVIPASLSIGAALGALNGVLVAILRLPPVLVTLGTMAAYRGAAQAMLGADSVKLPASFKGFDQALLLGLPQPVWVLLVASILAWAGLHRTAFGRRLLAIGGGEAASRRSGVRVESTQISVFALAGVAAGVGALLLDSRLGIARPSLARGAELEAITIAVLGGASIEGGRGSVMGTFLALVIMILLKSAMGVAGLAPEVQLTITGGVFVLAVVATSLGRSLRNRLLSQ